MNENTIIRSVPAADALRKVSGFDPLKYLRLTTSRKTGEKVLKLDLDVKKLWFRLFWPNGRMVHNVLRITDQIAIIEAQLFASREDTVPISNFTATMRAADAPHGMYIRFAQDEALDQALSNAGFGIQLCDVLRTSEGNQYGSEIPLAQVEAARTAALKTADEAPKAAVENTGVAASAGIPVENQASPAKEPVIMENVAPAEEVPAHAEEVQPVAVVEEQQPPADKPAVLECSAEETVQPVEPTEPVAPVSEEPSAQPAAESAVVTMFPEVIEEAPAAENYTPDMSVDEICQRMTLEEARGIVVDIGTCKGWTLEQVAERRPPILKFYVRGVSEANNVLKAAASLLLSDMEQQKAG